MILKIIPWLLYGVIFCIIMKKFEVPCFFGGKKSMVPLYIGNPEPSHNPVQFQSDWLSKERGGQVPPQIIESLVKIQKLAADNGLAFEELCHYALEAANENLKNDTAQESVENAEMKNNNEEEKKSE